MNTREIKDIFNILINKQVPPYHSVSFCLKLYGKQLNEISKDAGVTRGFFYQALAGKRKPNERMKKELDALGINPWN
ncbi:MAG: hypothetical protein ABIC04_07875 [Nanoarchaeota archaeon]